MYNILFNICVYGKMITSVRLVNIHHHTEIFVTCDENF